MSNNQNQNRLTRAIDWEDAQAILDVCDTVEGSVASVAGAGDIDCLADPIILIFDSNCGK